MCQSCAPNLDAAGSAEFGERFVSILNNAGLALMISVGHRTGLFDTLDRLGPSTSDQLAEAGGLSERYVREWLGAMTAGGIVDLDDARYALPGAHADFLTRRASPNNLGVSTQFVSVLGSVEDEIVDCFRNGGGVGYERFGRFHEVMADESDQTVVSALEEHLLPLAPGLEERLVAGADVADAGCGRGRALLHLAARFPASRFTGLDLSRDAVAWANAEAERRGLGNVTFRVQDLATWNEPGAFDVVFAFDSIHDQKDPAHMLAAIHGALRLGGLFFAQDIAGHSDHGANREHPLAPFVYTISCMHCMTVSLAQGGAGLGAAWGQELAESMLRDAGFADITVRSLDHDIMNVFYVCPRA